MTIKKLGILIAASAIMGLAACSDEPAATIDLLAAGDPKVCLAGDVLEQVKEATIPFQTLWTGERAGDYPKADFVLENATATQVSKEGHTIACQASFSLALNGQRGTSTSVNVAYRVAPDLAQEGQFLISGDTLTPSRTARLILQNYGIM